MVEFLLRQVYNGYTIYTVLGKQEIREETKAQKEIAAYISRNNISASEVARKTKVDVGLLTGKAERKMNASEMLSVCAYLEIEPLSLI